MDTSKEFEVPITINFDQKRTIGHAKVRLDEYSRTAIGEGTYTLEPAFIVLDYKYEDDVVVFKDIELIEISLVQSINKPKIKRKKKTNDNDNSTDSITG